jgi:hypothetical protein
MQSSATYSCPSLSYHRGMVRSPSSWMIWGVSERVDCRSAQVKCQAISRCTGCMMNFVRWKTCNDCHTNDNVCGPWIWMMAVMMMTKTLWADTSSNFTVQLL